MGQFDDDTDVTAIGAGHWRVTPSPHWNIGENANGGYGSALVLSACAQACDHPDPMSVTTHFLRPLQPDGSAAEIGVEVVRVGRAATVVRGSLHHAGKERLVVVAAFGDLGVDGGTGVDEFGPAPPELPPPADCTDRAELAQGVDHLSILDRLDVRLRPEHARLGGASDAVMEGWIRLADGSPPTSRVLPLFADAFPPSLFPRLGRVGWVPTLELTVHVRRRPAPGWVQARLECDDLAGGRMIETATLWDAEGTVVARSRQLGLVLTSG